MEGAQCGEMSFGSSRFESQPSSTSTWCIEDAAERYPEDGAHFVEKNNERHIVFSPEAVEYSHCTTVRPDRRHEIIYDEGHNTSITLRAAGMWYHHGITCTGTFLCLGRTLIAHHAGGGILWFWSVGLKVKG